MTWRSKELDFRGDLQAEVMATVWKLGEAKVEDVRQQQPARKRSAYTTIQTVMQRLYERGLLTRDRRRNAWMYRPAFGEGEYLARAIEERLADASKPARLEALVNLVDRLPPGELDELARYAARIRRARGKG